MRRPSRLKPASLLPGVQMNVLFGHFISAANPRRIQLTLKFYF